MIYNITSGLNANLSGLSNDASKILTGYSFIGKSGEKVDGAMPDRDSDAGISLTVTNSSKTVMYGYYPSQFVIDVSSESLSAYPNDSNGIPIEILSESNTDVSTDTVRGSNDKFLKEVTGVPSNIRVGFLNSNDSIISNASDITSTIGGSNILPGKSLGIKYKAGIKTYTYKVDSGLQYETLNGEDIEFKVGTSGLTYNTLSPSENKVIESVTYVPNSVGLTTNTTLPSGKGTNLGPSSWVVRGHYAITAIKSGSDTLKYGYLVGEYDPPTISSSKTQSVGFTTTVTSPASATVSPNSGDSGVASVVCAKTISFNIVTDANLPSGSTQHTSNASTVIRSGYNAVIGTKVGSTTTYRHIPGSFASQTKIMPVPTASFNADTPSSMSTVTPDTSKYLSSVSVPGDMHFYFLTDNAFSSLGGTNHHVGSSSHIDSSYNFVLRFRCGDGSIHNFYIDGT